MKKRSISIILLIALFAAFMCSCSNPAQKRSGSKYPDVDFSGRPVTITYMTVGDKPTNGKTEEVVDRLNRILVRDLNVTLDVFYISWTDYLQNYDKTLSDSEVSIDLVGTGTDWLDAWPNAMNGNFMPLSEEMIKTYCPRTYENVTKEQWDACSYGGRIYFIPENEFTQWTNHGFIYRADIAREAGIQSIDSWEELTRYFKYVKEKKPDMIPWDSDGSNTVMALGYITSKTDYIPIYEVTAYGIFGAYKSDPTKIVSPFYKGDELLEFAKLMKKWDEMGVWREDLTASPGSGTAFIAGTSAAEEHHTQNFFAEKKPESDMSIIGSDAEFYWFGKESGNLLRTSILHGAMAVSSSSQNPERALMVYDYLRNDPECYRLIRYGIEGDQYVLTADGGYDKPNGYNAARDGVAFNYWWGRRDELELKDVNAAWDAYKKLEVQYNMVAIDYPWDNYPFSAMPDSEDLKRIDNVCNIYIPQIIYGNYDCTPEKEIEDFRRALKFAGIDRVTKNLQQLLDVYSR